MCNLSKCKLNIIQLKSRTPGVPEFLEIRRRTYAIDINKDTFLAKKLIIQILHFYSLYKFHRKKYQYY